MEADAGSGVLGCSVLGVPWWVGWTQGRHEVWVLGMLQAGDTLTGLLDPNQVSAGSFGRTLFHGCPTRHLRQKCCGLGVFQGA